MQITAVSPSKTYVGWDEPFDVAVTIKLGSNEAVSNESAEFSFYPPHEYIVQPDPAYEPDTLFSLGFITGIKIAKGGSKTFRFTGVTLRSMHDSYDTVEEYKAILDDEHKDRVPLSFSIIFYGASGASAEKTNALNFLTRRLGPTISGVAVTDARQIANPLTGETDTALNYFGRFVAGQSLPHIVVDYALDPLDPTLTAEVTLTLGRSYIGMVPGLEDTGGPIPTPVLVEGTVYEYDGASMSSADGVFDLGPDAITAAYDNIEIIVTDSAGSMACWHIMDIPLYDYAAPALTQFRALRYREELTEEGTRYVQAPDGPHLMVDLAGSAAAVGGRNACKLRVGYRAYGAQAWIMSDAQTGADGMSAAYAEDRTIFGALAFSASTTYEVVAVLTDCFGEARLLGDLVLKAAAIINIERTGVAVGMRSTGTEANPLFQCAHPAKFYSDVMVPAEGLLKTVKVTVASAEAVEGGATASYTVPVNAGDGWTPIGIVGYSANSRWVMMIRSYLDDNGEAACTVYNHGTPSRNVTIIMYVLCMRTG